MVNNTNGTNGAAPFKICIAGAGVYSNSSILEAQDADSVKVWAALLPHSLW
jgi:hypothetical protein